jgi:hypothetical protein
MASQADVIEVIDFLAKAMDYRNLDQGIIRAWSIVFRDTPRLWLVRHAMRWIENEKWFPKPAELKARIDDEVYISRHRQTNNRWQPPAEPHDEAAMWLCFLRGCDPGDLSQKDLAGLPAVTEMEVSA